METVINAHKSVIGSAVNSKSNSTSLSTYDRWIEKLKFSYFGIIAMTITIGSIMGGFAAMAIFENNGPIWQLGLAMATAMANNVACIGQAPTKWVINLFFLCAGVNALLILINII